MFHRYSDNLRDMYQAPFPAPPWQKWPRDADKIKKLEAENGMLRVELQEARDAIDAIRPQMLTSLDVLDSLPVGSIVRAEHWGDVAVKVQQRIWNGEGAPTADELRDNDDSNFTEHVYWEVCGGGGLTDCDGPFLLIYRGWEGQEEA